MTLYARYDTAPSSVSYGGHMNEEEARRAAERTALAEQLRRIQEPVLAARRQLAEAEKALLPQRDSLMLRLYEAGMGPTEIGKIVGVARQTVHQGMTRARLARALADTPNASTTPQP